MRYALATDKQFYALGEHEAELSKLAGQKVTVKGTTNDGTVTVQPVAAAR